MLVREGAQGLRYSPKFRGAEDLEILQCDSCETAMRFVESQIFDLVVVDEGSPAPMAHDLMQHLSRYSPSTPFVLLTNHTRLACYLRAFAMAWRACRLASA